MPIVQKMPRSLSSKWEKEVARFAEENNDAYPKFHNLAKIVEKQSVLKNHPNIATPTTDKFRIKQRIHYGTYKHIFQIRY